MLDRKNKDKIIKKFKMHDADTGSSPVQIAILTEEIKQLTKHLKTHKKDFSSRRGLLRKVAERRKLLAYLKRESQETFDKVVQELKLKVVLPEQKQLLDTIEEEIKGEVEEVVEETSDKTKDVI